MDILGLFGFILLIVSGIYFIIVDERNNKLKKMKFNYDIAMTQSIEKVLIYTKYLELYKDMNRSLLIEKMKEIETQYIDIIKLGINRFAIAIEAKKIVIQGGWMFDFTPFFTLKEYEIIANYNAMFETVYSYEHEHFYSRAISYLRSKYTNY